MESLDYQRGRIIPYEVFHQLVLECFSNSGYTPLEYETLKIQDIWSVMEHGQLCGILAASCTETQFHISKLAVRKVYRRRGIGARLLALALDDAKQRGYPKVTLNVLADNLPASLLYDKMGFVPYGRQTRFSVTREEIPLDCGNTLVMCDGQGYRFPVRFLENRIETGKGMMNTEIGGCKEFQLKNPEDSFNQILAGLRKYMKPSQAQLYLMSDQENIMDYCKQKQMKIDCEIIKRQVVFL